MKNVQISLPDDLAQDAAEAGLLVPETLQAVLRDCLRQRAQQGLKALMAVTANDVTDAANEAKIVAMVREVRARRRVEQARSSH